MSDETTLTPGMVRTLAAEWYGTRSRGDTPNHPEIAAKYGFILAEIREEDGVTRFRIVPHPRFKGALRGREAIAAAKCRRWPRSRATARHALRLEGQVVPGSTAQTDNRNVDNGDG